jgi:hypothetical protein
MKFYLGLSFTSKQTFVEICYLFLQLLGLCEDVSLLFLGSNQTFRLSSICHFMEVRPRLVHE